MRRVTPITISDRWVCLLLFLLLFWKGGGTASAQTVDNAFQINLEGGLGISSLQDISIPASNSLHSTLPFYHFRGVLYREFEKFRLLTSFSCAYWGTNRFSSSGLNLPVGSKNYSLIPVDLDTNFQFSLNRSGNLRLGAGFSLQYVYFKREQAITASDATAIKDTLFFIGPNYGFYWNGKVYSMEIFHVLSLTPWGRSTFQQNDHDTIQYNPFGFSSNFCIAVERKFRLNWAVKLSYRNYSLLSGRLNAYVLNTYSANLFVVDSILVHLLYGF